MKKYFIYTLGILLISAGIFIALSYSGIILSGTGGLQVTSNIKSKVYLNEKYIGDAPLCKCSQKDTVKKGEYDLKIVPEDKSFSPFIHRVNINKGVLTVVDRTFLPGALASTYILSLEKIDSKEAQLLITSLPEGVLISIDDNPQGVTPFLLKKIEPKEYDLELTKEGFNKKALRIKTVSSYRLIADIILGTKNDKNEKTDVLPVPSKSPAEPKASESAVKKNEMVKIKDTPNNFLRVREEPSVNSAEITRVKPGEEFPFLKEENDWFEIKLPDGKTGWVSGDYSQKVSQ